MYFTSKIKPVAFNVQLFLKYPYGVRSLGLWVLA